MNKSDQTAENSEWLRAVGVIRDGGLVVFPTDTVYGVGCDPYNTEAIARIYNVKGRDMQKAIPLLLADVSCLEQVAESFPAEAERLGARFWPGALTVVIPRRSELPAILSEGPTIAARVPDHTELREFIKACGGAIAATSANLSGQPDATDASAARDYLGEKVDLVIDGGQTRGGVPSTVVDCTQSPPRVLREGAISAEEIYRALEPAGEEL